MEHLQSLLNSVQTMRYKCEVENRKRSLFSRFGVRERIPADVPQRGE
jgi:hypothetical protein